MLVLWVSNTHIYCKHEELVTVFFEFLCLLRGVLERLKDTANAFVLSILSSTLTSPSYSIPYSRCGFKSITEICNDIVARRYLEIKWYSRVVVNLQLARLETRRTGWWICCVIDPTRTEITESWQTAGSYELTVCARQNGLTHTQVCYRSYQYEILVFVVKGPSERNGWLLL